MKAENTTANSGESLVLTPVETAKLLRIGRATVYEQIRQGTIPSLRMGRKILVPRKALEKLLDVDKPVIPNDTY
jgi:excisionase family DNA binding protein